MNGKLGRCDLCGGSGWATQTSPAGISVGPCACVGGQPFKPENFAWFLHAGLTNAPDGLGRLIVGILKDGRQVLGQAFTKDELLGFVAGGKKTPLDMMLYVLVSELSRLHHRVGELEQKLAQKPPA